MRDDRPIGLTSLAAFCLILVVTAGSTPAEAQVVSDEFVGPLFGLNARAAGGLLVADAGSGILRIRHGRTRLMTELPGVTDASPSGAGFALWAVTGEPPEDPGLFPQAQRVFLTAFGRAREVANLYEYEMANNPDGGDVVSNPFDLAPLGASKTLVADAGANDLLLVERHRGRVDWVATFPTELESTADTKALVGCPDAPPDLAFVCGFPEMLPTQPVPTSVVLGAERDYFVGELKGFPAPLGASRVWRIERGARNVRCGEDPECSIVLDGLTSIIDLAVDRHGTLYVLEIDELGWLAVELGAGVGGRLKACDVVSGQCDTVASGLPLPTATTVTFDGSVFATILALIPGQAAVVNLGRLGEDGWSESVLAGAEGATVATTLSLLGRTRSSWRALGNEKLP